MKPNISSSIKRAGEKLTQTAGTAVKAAQILSEKAVDSAKNTALDLTEKARENAVKAQLKKYNPVMPEEYFSDAFALPNLIVIADDAVRKNIDVCRGAIGWRSQEKGVEVLHLYDEFLPDCGLHFIPAAICDSAYYVDPHNRTRFIRLDSLFGTMQQSRMAELSNIAYCLGAKYAEIEIVEKDLTQKRASQKENIKAAKSAEEVSREASSSNSRMNRSAMTFNFPDEREPVRPELCWFAQHDTILGLIQMICDQKDNHHREFNLVLEGADSATMSVHTAAKLDGALKGMNLHTAVDVQAKALTESSCKMMFHLQF